MPGLGLVITALVVLAVGIVYWIFVVYRRTVLQHAPAAAERRDGLGRATKVILALSLGLTFALLVGFVVSDVELPRRLGAASIILLAFASWILFGSIVLVLLPGGLSSMGTQASVGRSGNSFCRITSFLNICCAINTERYFL